jgi:hypothetical protein
MYEHHRAALIQGRHQRVEGGIAEVATRNAGEQDHAVGAEPVEGLSGLSDRAVDVGQRQGGEEAEPVGVIFHQLGDLLVDHPRHPAGLHVVAQMDTGRRDGHDGRGDPGLVQVSDRSTRAPGGQSDPASHGVQAVGVQPVGHTGGSTW